MTAFEERVQIVWSLATQARDTNPNWGLIMDARNRMVDFRRDPHPRIRRIALDYARLDISPAGGPGGGGLAA